MKNKHTGRKVTNVSPASLANLRRFDQMSKEEHLELSRKGQQKTAEIYRDACKKKRTFREAVEWATAMEAFHTADELVESMRMKYPDLDNTQAMAIALVKKAITDGDAKAFATLRDTVGETPQQALSLQNSEPMTINIRTVE